ncbi:hypothetical protein CGCVW01_v009310 [Colletotrichum viniferum]|nr:hypothetical protein CGCVW01_v009310 [Colletotrichum viniferum]
MDWNAHLEFLRELIISAVILTFGHYTNIIPLTSFLGVSSPNYILPPLSVLIGHLLWHIFAPDARPEDPTEYLILARAYFFNFAILMWALFLFPFLLVALVSAIGLVLPFVVLWAVYRCFRPEPAPEVDEFGWRHDVNTTRLREPYALDEFPEDNVFLRHGFSNQ